MRSKLPDSITNQKLIKLYEAALAEMDLITLESAYPYIVSDSLNSPTPEVVPFMAHDMNINQLEYSLATENEDEGSFALRRALIKNSFRLHQRKGTAGIIEEIFAKTGRSDGKLLEWWEYGAAAFRFMVELKTPLPRRESDMLLGLIKRYKRGVTKLDTKYKTVFGVKKTYAAVVRNDRVIKYAVEFGVPFALDLSALYFSDAGFSEDGKEIQSRMPLAAPVAVVSKRLVANFDGASLITHGVRGSDFSGNEGTIAIRVKLDAGVTSGGLLRATEATKVFYYPYNTSLIYCPVMRIARVDGIAISSTVDMQDWHWVIITTKPGADGWKLYQDNDNIATTDGEAGISMNYFVVGNSISSVFLNGSISDVMVLDYYADAAEVANIVGGGNPSGNILMRSRCEGSCDDTSGNGFHGENDGVNLLAVCENAAGVDSSALHSGFGVGIEGLADWDMSNSGADEWLTSKATLSKIPDTTGHGTNIMRITSDGTGTFYARQTGIKASKLVKICGLVRTDGLARFTVIGDTAYIYYGDFSTDWTYFEVYTMMNPYGYVGIGSNTSVLGTYVEFAYFSIKEVSIPRLDDLSGYARPVSEEHPALVSGHNTAPVDVSFSSDIDDDLMNKSRTNIWKDGAREDEYDPTRPNDWSEKTLIPEFVDDNIQDAYKNRIFMAVQRNADGAVTAVADLCIYKRSLTAEERAAVEAWLESSTFIEKQGG